MSFPSVLCHIQNHSGIAALHGGVVASSAVYYTVSQKGGMIHRKWWNSMSTPGQERSTAMLGVEVQPCTSHSLALTRVWQGVQRGGNVRRSAETIHSHTEEARSGTFQRWSGVAPSSTLAQVQKKTIQPQCFCVLYQPFRCENAPNLLPTYLTLGT
jgi:hypothetical protein